MNIEFVYLILIGINNFMEDMSKSSITTHKDILDQRKFKKPKHDSIRKMEVERMQDKTIIK